MYIEAHSLRFVFWFVIKYCCDKLLFCWRGCTDSVTYDVKRLIASPHIKYLLLLLLR